MTSVKKVLLRLIKAFKKVLQCVVDLNGIKKVGNHQGSFYNRAKLVNILVMTTGLE